MTSEAYVKILKLMIRSLPQLNSLEMKSIAHVIDGALLPAIVSREDTEREDTEWKETQIGPVVQFDGQPDAAPDPRGETGERDNG